MIDMMDILVSKSRRSFSNCQIASFIELSSQLVSLELKGLSKQTAAMPESQKATWNHVESKYTFVSSKDSSTYYTNDMNEIEW